MIYPHHHNASIYGEYMRLYSRKIKKLKLQYNQYNSNVNSFGSSCINARIAYCKHTTKKPEHKTSNTKFGCWRSHRTEINKTTSNSNILSSKPYNRSYFATVGMVAAQPEPMT